MCRSSAYGFVAATILVVVACGRSPLDSGAPDANVETRDAGEGADSAPDEGPDGTAGDAVADVLVGEAAFDAPVRDAIADVEDARADAACVAPVPRDGGVADAGVVADWADLLDAQPTSIARDADGNVTHTVRARRAPVVSGWTRAARCT